MQLPQSITRLLVLSTLSVSLLTACGSDSATTQQPGQQAAKADHALARNVALAINVGGDAYWGGDGVFYQADELNSNGRLGSSGKIKGSQDPILFQSYRVGDIDFELPVNNGSYDILFKFAEPEQTAIGERVFDVLAENKVVIDDLDVRLARDGKVLSSLVRAATDIEVTDGSLSVSFNPSAGEPLLHAIVVRNAATEVEADESEWQLVWHDEFDYEGAPDPSKWNFDIWPARKVNDEDQTYTDRAKNARVTDGHLIIEAHKEQYNGAEYTSARLNSLNKGDFLYGRADVRARIPAGQGTWSAIWMLPSDPYKYATSCQPNEDWQGSSTCDAWPNSGEIDIMEHVGYDMQTIHGTVHNKAYYWMNWEQRKASIEGKNVEQEFHVYSVEWTPEHIIVLLDNSPYFFYRNEGTGWKAWPFDHPYHLILNLAVGGAWGRSGGPIDDSIFPVQMEVDYVRVFKRKD